MLRAVIDGINEYIYNADQNRLRGCVNDANNLLAKWKPNDHIILYDRQCTKQNIMAAWRNMLQKCVPGDVLRIAQSSHGMEEGICCYNLDVKDNAWNPDGYISYHEIAEFCKEIPQTILAEFHLDCCHCENQLRSLGRVYGKAKYMLSVTESGQPPIVIPPRPVKPTSVGPNIVLWAACEPKQTSADAYIDNQAQGAFTAAVIKFAKSGRTRSDVIFYAREWLNNQGYEQRPHLYTSSTHSLEVWL